MYTMAGLGLEFEVEETRYGISHRTRKGLYSFRLAFLFSIFLFPFVRNELTPAQAQASEPCSADNHGHQSRQATVSY